MTANLHKYYYVAEFPPKPKINLLAKMVFFNMGNAKHPEKNETRRDTKKKAKQVEQM